jgi:hypothetical protein
MPKSVGTLELYRQLETIAERMQTAAENANNDKESVHVDADGLLVDALQALMPCFYGPHRERLAKIIELYYSVPKWYA